MIYDAYQGGSRSFMQQVKLKNIENGEEACTDLADERLIYDLELIASSKSIKKRVWSWMIS